MPAYIVVVAIVCNRSGYFYWKAYVPTLYDSLGVYIPLIVVNCIILRTGGILCVRRTGFSCLHV